MKRIGLIAAGFLVLLVLVAAAGFALFKGVERKIAARMHAPKLEIRREPAEDFAYSTLDGESRRLASTKGKVVFLDLWGTWCVQCVAEMPTVQKLYDHYRNDPEVMFLIVSRMDSPSKVRAYSRRNRFDLPFYVMQDEDIPESMRLNQFPSTFLYAKDGSMAAKHVGAADWSDRSVIRWIDRLKRQ